MSRKHPMILDGGMSRELIRLKAPFRQPEWSALALIEAPHYVQQVHSEFIFAGANIITTNSYALVPFHIGQGRFHERGTELAALAGQLARSAVDKAVENNPTGQKAMVAGSLPPMFGSYEPQNFDASKVQDYLSVLVRGLEPHVDVWLGETLSLIAEADAVQVAVKATGKPFWIAFTLDERSVDSYNSPAKLRSGESVAEAAVWTLNSDAKALLFNCSRPEVMGLAIRDAKDVFDQHGRAVPIGVYANSFVPTSDEYAANSDVAAVRRDMTPEVYASFAQQWVQDGASIVGGCCGIGCEHIQRLAQSIRT